MSESTIQKQIMLALSRAGITVWRNNSGQAWTGDSTRVSRPGPVHLNPGDAVIRNARPLHAGLCVGSSDLIGVTPLQIEPHHVGKTIGVFTAVEVKAPKGRPTTQQLHFIDFVSGVGGLAGIAKSPEDALDIIERHKNSP